MYLDQCRKIATEKFLSGQKELFFDLMNKDKVLHCYWIDPENGIFGVVAIPGFIDMREMGKFFKSFKRCELIKRE